MIQIIDQWINVDENHQTSELQIRPDLRFKLKHLNIQF